MIFRSSGRLAFALCFVALAAASAPRLGLAQIYNRPPIEDFDGGEPAAADRDAAGLGMRVDRLERELRSMTGRVEELQHSVRVLEEQLRARQDGAAASMAPPPAAAPAGAPVVAERRTPPAPAASQRTPSGDAFDPASNPGAAGAPRPIGQTSASAPLPTHPVATVPVREPGAPLDLTPAAQQGAQAAVPAASPAAPDGAAAQSALKEEYNQAVALMRAQQYEAGERSLAAFLVKYPKSRYAPAATYGLGESFFLRSRYREAAEKYLEIKVKYPQSAQAPEALLRLGQSLAAIGAREQACASFTEIGVTYPGSPARLRESAQRESKKLQC
jgi:tol-pal system protein YbgF